MTTGKAGRILTKIPTNLYPENLGRCKETVTWHFGLSRQTTLHFDGHRESAEGLQTGAAAEQASTTRARLMGGGGMNCGLNHCEKCKRTENNKEKKELGLVFGEWRLEAFDPLAAKRGKNLRLFAILALYPTYLRAFTRF